MENALKEINILFNDNVVFNRFDVQENGNIQFTLKVKNSKEAGARFSPNGRKLASACWHVYGEFFDALLNENNSAVIISSYTKEPIKIYMENDEIVGNWQDWNAGNYYNPVKVSKLCLCE